MHPRLQRDSTPWHLPEYVCHRFRSRAQLLFQQHVARFIQHAIPTRSIAQLQTDRQFLLSKFLLCFDATVLILFIAGLLYLLRFERVDNLGAYRIPRRPAMDVLHPRCCGLDVLLRSHPLRRSKAVPGEAVKLTVRHKFLLVDNFGITRMIGRKKRIRTPFQMREMRPLRLGERGLDMSSIRVLVVEDFVAFRRVISSILGEKRELQTICEVSDGLEAAQKAEELKPDLILLDIGLPALNGIGAARQIRKRSPESKILFLSQESSADGVQEALSLGALGYVVKAHVGSDLLVAVEAVLSGKQFVSTLANDNLPSRPRRNLTRLCDTVGD